MEVRALIRRMLPDIPRDQWLRLIGELRDEIDDIQRKVLAESEVKRNGAAQRGAP
jgi:hypothetical protein